VQFTHSNIVRLYVFCEISSSHYELYCANCAQSMTDDPKEYWYEKLKSEETTEQSLLLCPCHNPLNMGLTLTNASLRMAHGHLPAPPSPFLSAVVSQKNLLSAVIPPSRTSGTTSTRHVQAPRCLRQCAPPRRRLARLPRRPPRLLECVARVCHARRIHYTTRPPNPSNRHQHPHAG
jgi:hypothetical protein